MTEQRPVTAMDPVGIASAVRSGAETAALDIAGTSSRDIALGTLSLRVPHNATAADVARAVRVAIAGRL